MSSADLTEQQEVATPAETSVEKRVRRRRWQRLGWALLSLVLVASTIAWINREGIAKQQINERLDGLGLEASYEIEQISAQSQILKNIVVGDPARPDLTVERVEVVLQPTLTGSVIDRIILDRPTIYGTYADGDLTFGELDSLIFSDSDRPFEFPDFALEIREGRGLLQSDHGDVGLSFDSDGHLRGGFTAQIAANAPVLSIQDCTLNDATFEGLVAIQAELPRLSGPFKIARAECQNGARVADAEVQVNAGSDRLLTAYDATLAVETGLIKFGQSRVASLTGKGEFGWKDDLLIADYELSGDRLSAQQVSLAKVNLTGDFRALDGFEDLEARASIKGDNVQVGNALDRQLASYVASSDGTLAAPLLAKLRAALANELPGSELTADLLWRSADEGINLLVPQLQMNRRNGATLLDASRLQVAFQEGRAPRIAGNFITGGQNIPDAMGRFEIESGNTFLDFSMREYRSGNSAAALPNMQLALAPNGAIRFEGEARATGPIPQGQITNLSAPVLGRISPTGTLELWDSCTNFVFDQLEYADLKLANRRLRICPGTSGTIVTNDAEGLRVAAQLPQAAIAGTFANERFAINSSNMSLDYNAASGDFSGAASGVTASGRYSGQTFAFNSPRASIDAVGVISAPNSALRLGRGSRAARIKWADLSVTPGDTANAANVEVEIGRGSGLTRMTFGEIDAELGETISGKFSEGDVMITPVPLNIFDAAGDFTFEGGILEVFNGNFRLEDRAVEDRFKPMFGRNATLVWNGDKIDAGGPLFASKSSNPVLTAKIDHRIASGVGFADLRVENLTFDDDLQPDDLTELTFGVIANVEGAVSGTGRIDWAGDGSVTSNGRFATKKLDLAAPFGPAKGLSGEIVFTDLLNFTTPADQQIAVQSINPGIEVFDGVLDYRMENGELLLIREGTWPFLGGTLTLKPSTFGFSREERRDFTMIIEGAQAALFLEQMELGNISATGTFDGELPLVFEGVDGRIVGGKLTARAPGGNLSYVGELTYEDMGAIANFAFGSLRSLDFERMTLQIDGPLTGDLVTKIQFEGVSQGQGARRNFITRQIAELPIEFNVNIKAPFYKLLTSLRSLYDPSFVRDPRDVGLVVDDRGLPPRDIESLKEGLEKLDEQQAK